jgi:hypothetical protein
VWAYSGQAFGHSMWFAVVLVLGCVIWIDDLAMLLWQGLQENQFKYFETNVKWKVHKAKPLYFHLVRLRKDVPFSSR